MKAATYVFTAVLSCLPGTVALLAAPGKTDAPARTDGAPAERPAQPDNAADFEAWLTGHPEFKKHLVWVAGDGKRLPFDEWTAAQKGMIQQFYQASHDFRLLAVLADSVVGHTPGKMYPFVQAMQSVFSFCT